MIATSTKHTTKAEYPREGCPECHGPVTAVLVTCDMDEEHERFNCKNETCRERDICEDDLVWVKSVEDYPAGLEEAATLNAADLLATGKVMPSLREWVTQRVATRPAPGRTP